MEDVSEILERTPPLHPHDRDIVLLDMARRIGKIEANSETVVNVVGQHEDRIRALEKRQWSVPGTSLLLALLAFFGVHPH